MPRRGVRLSSHSRKRATKRTWRVASTTRVDPADRLVAGELERRWNGRLAEVQRQEERVAAIGADKPSLSAAERERLLSLGADLGAAWTHPGASAETRKRILRSVLEEIVVTLARERIELLLHWRGGDHTRLMVPRNRTGQHRHSSDAEVQDLIRALARQQLDGAIAATLNRLGKRTGRGNPWTEARVRSFRSHHRLPAYRPGEMAERDELSLEEASRRLDVSKMTVLRLIGDGAIAARQVCSGEPPGPSPGADRGPFACHAAVRPPANSRSRSKGT